MHCIIHSDVITYPCWDLSESMLVKEAPVVLFFVAIHRIVMEIWDFSHEIP